MRLRRWCPRGGLPRQRRDTAGRRRPCCPRTCTGPSAAAPPGWGAPRSAAHTHMGGACRRGGARPGGAVVVGPDEPVNIIFLSHHSSTSHQLRSSEQRLYCYADLIFSSFFCSGSARLFCAVAFVVPGPLALLLAPTPGEVGVLILLPFSACPYYAAVVPLHIWLLSLRLVFLPVHRPCMKFYCSILDVLYACGPYHLIYTEPLLAVCFFYVTLLSFISHSVKHNLLCCICSVVKYVLCHFITALLIFFLQ